jgi:hypothetical protein
VEGEEIEEDGQEAALAVHVELQAEEEHQGK